MSHVLPSILFAIFARDASKTLELYLKYISDQDYPKDRIFLWVRTNDNSDSTESMLKSFLTECGDKYLGTQFDSSHFDLPPLPENRHQWDLDRLSIMSQIRQESVDFASNYDFDFYFTCDVDYFISRSTLSSLVDLNCAAVAPYLKMIIPESNPLPAENNYYSTFQDWITENGSYLGRSQRHSAISEEILSGVLQTNLIHGAYLIRRDVYSSIDFNFLRNNYEYRNLSLSLKAKGIRQFVDARKVYGYMTLSDQVDRAENELELLNEKKSEILTSLAFDTNEELALANNSVFPKKVITTNRLFVRQKEFIMNNSHIDFEFYKGKNGSDLLDTDFSSLGIKEMENWRPNVLAAALNHRTLWEEAASSNSGLIILEDDSLLVTDFDRILLDLFADRAIEPHLVYLGYNWDAPIELDVFENGMPMVNIFSNSVRISENLNLIKHQFYTSKLYRVNEVWGRHCYFVSPQGANQLLSLIPSMDTKNVSIGSQRKLVEKPWSFDHLVNSILPNINAYAAFPPIAFSHNNKNESTLWNMVN